MINPKFCPLSQTHSFVHFFKMHFALTFSKDLPVIQFSFLIILPIRQIFQMISLLFIPHKYIMIYSVLNFDIDFYCFSPWNEIASAVIYIAILSCWALFNFRAIDLIINTYNLYWLDKNHRQKVSEKLVPLFFQIVICAVLF